MHKYFSSFSHFRYISGEMCFFVRILRRFFGLNSMKPFDDDKTCDVVHKYSVERFEVSEDSYDFNDFALLFDDSEIDELSLVGICVVSFEFNDSKLFSCNSFFCELVSVYVISMLDVIAILLLVVPSKVGVH